MVGRLIHDIADGGVVTRLYRQYCAFTRGSMIEVLHSNFIRTARAKGYLCGGSFYATH